jgi:hypothetical protein
MGDSISEGTIATWHKAPGDQVRLPACPNPARARLARAASGAGARAEPRAAG